MGGRPRDWGKGKETRKIIKEEKNHEN